MKIKLTESQYKKIVLREFGETVIDPKEWYLQILSWVDSPKDLTFKTNASEIVVFDQDGVYLGYYDKEQQFGFVVTEYNVDSMDDELIDEVFNSEREIFEFLGMEYLTPEKRDV